MKNPARSLLVLIVLVLAAGAASQWWHARGEAELGARLASAAREGDIRMVSSVDCVYCAHARAWMREHKVVFSECMIEKDADCRAVFEAAGARATPTLLVRGNVQLGFDPERVLAVLTPPGRG
jgi:glutaredoxin